jgi:hypothetical protein
VHCSSCLAWWSSFQIDFSPKQQQQQQLLKHCPIFFSNIIIIIIIPLIQFYFLPPWILTLSVIMPGSSSVTGGEGLGVSSS